MADAPATGGLFSFLAAQPRAWLGIWILPALGVAALVTLVDAPVAAAQGPALADKLLGLGLLAAWSGAVVFLVALAAAPTSAARAGAPWLAPLRRAAPWLVAASLAVRLGLVGALALLPAALANLVNPLMAEIFAAAGIIGGAAVVVALLARWQLAPGLAARGSPAAPALAESARLSAGVRSFGAGLGTAAAFAGAVLAGVAAAALADAALHAWWARLLGAALALLVLLPAGPLGAARRLDEAGAGAPTRSLALRWRPSRCPRCGALAQAPTGGGAVTCPGCGLRGALR